jgi:hypothetical protein
MAARVAARLTRVSLAQAERVTEQRLVEIERRLSVQERALNELKDQGGVAFAA